MARTDWNKAENEYITTTITYEELAEKYNVSIRTVHRQAKNREWQQKKADFVTKVSEECQAKTGKDEVDRILKITKDIGDTAEKLLEKLKKDLETYNDVDSKDKRVIAQNLKDAQTIFHLAYGRPTSITENKADPEAQKAWKEFVIPLINREKDDTD
jgi:NADPH:quinone reductase-like Zn-dependent oxidoreductase